MTEAESEREKQRSEIEARNIIHDIDRLNTLPENKKTRWVWELLQNAKDVANINGVNIVFELGLNKIIISHNGLPFETKHLLAILYKTSTKTLNGEDGTTGKYGTGFVTTHILSKKLTIEGIHKNTDGERKFSLELDRTAATLKEKEALDAMQLSITETFKKIEKISSLPPEAIDEYRHSFTYPLNEYSKKYAEKGLIELENNLPFTLLINQREKKKINSVTIKKPDYYKKFIANPENSPIMGLKYIQTGESEGILYQDKGDLLFGIPVVKMEDIYKIKPIENQSVLFKEFPLIGTENFNLPVFIQHNNFKPTELRDGIRTKKEVEEQPDYTADSNRKALTEFRDEYLLFLNTLISNQLLNFHYLALSGLPEQAENYLNSEWYSPTIQIPIRNFLISKNIVRTASGQLISISNAKFPIANLTDDTDFYDLISNLMPDKIPDQDCIETWNKVINQESESWPSNIRISLESILNKLSEIINPDDVNSFEILKKLYYYLQKNKLTLGEEYPIYLNEKNEFKTRDEIAQYPLIDDEIKKVSKGLGRDLDEEFLNRKLGNVPEIKKFDLEKFYKTLNTDLISTLPVDKVNDEQLKAILHVCSLFKSDRAIKREKWYLIVKKLLPAQIGDKKTIKIDYENYSNSAELWSIKYICHLIETEKTIQSFAKQYFQDDNNLCFAWLNEFLNYIFSIQEENKNVILQRKIIPVQSGIFREYSEELFQEEDSNFFDNSIKDIFKKYTTKGDPRHFLICNELHINSIRKKGIDVLTTEIDKLFDDDEIEKKVKKDNPLHNLFLVLNNWYEQFPQASSLLKSFASKRAMLYVIALGEGFSKQIMSLQKCGKTMEDIAELAKINLSTEEMKQLEKVANELGTEKILQKAEEMIAIRDQRLKWKKIGNAAEKAFKKIFTNIEMDIELYNPDLGKDFEIMVKSKGFSIEIKNVIEGKESVRMSILQGQTAVIEKDNYALCVLTRPNDDAEIDENYFQENARFVCNIGYQIGDKIKNWNEGLNKLYIDENIKVSLDSKTETVYINRCVWKSGITFEDFVGHLKDFFNLKSDIQKAH